MKKLIAICCSLVLVGCVGLPSPDRSESMFIGDQFGAAPSDIGQIDVFALSPKMRAYLDERITVRAQIFGRSRALFEALRDDLHVDYDAAQTRTAAETFAARAGNCLSLAILTAAFAKQLGIPVDYRLAYGEPTWTRAGGIIFDNNHVNVALQRFHHFGLTHGRAEPGMIIDFAPQDDGRWYWDNVSEARIVAMFMNNRAAEALVDDNTNAAYWWSRAAIQKDASFGNAYNTLSIVYRRHGDTAKAEQALTVALQYSPNSSLLQSNMVGLLTAQGRTDEANELQRRLNRSASYRPFQFLDAGNDAMAAGDPDSAMKLYRKELRRIPYSSELHFAMAVAEARLGHHQDARKQLELAMQLSLNLSDRDLYAGKLEKLRALQSH